MGFFWFFLYRFGILADVYHSMDEIWVLHLRRVENKFYQQKNNDLKFFYQVETFLFCEIWGFWYRIGVFSMIYHPIDEIWVFHLRRVAN